MIEGSMLQPYTLMIEGLMLQPHTPDDRGITVTAPHPWWQRDWCYSPTPLMIERLMLQPHKLQSDHPLVLWIDWWKLHDKGFPAELQVPPPLVTVPQASIWPPCGTECLTGEMQDDVRLTPGLILTLTDSSHYQWTHTMNYVGGILFGIHQTFTLLPCFHLQWPLFGIFHA